MTGAEILDEHAKGELLTDAVFDALHRQGVDTVALARRVAAGQLDEPRLARIVHLGNGFEFADYTQDKPDVGGMIFVVRNHINDPVDLCAWSPPHAPALWCSRGSMLGGENLFKPRMTEGLLVHQTPLEWLRDLGAGVVVLNGAKAADLLWRAQPLEASSYELGQELKRLLIRPRPRIFVPVPNIGAKLAPASKQRRAA